MHMHVRRLFGSSLAKRLRWFSDLWPSHLESSGARSSGHCGGFSSKGYPKWSPGQSEQRGLCLQRAGEESDEDGACDSDHCWCGLRIWARLLWKLVLPVCVQSEPLPHLAVASFSYEKLSSSTCTSGSWHYVHLNATLTALVKLADCVRFEWFALPYLTFSLIQWSHSSAFTLLSC